jgi:hypothetical protein
MDPLSKRVVARFAAKEAGEGDDEKALASGKAFLRILSDLVNHAQHELETRDVKKNGPGSAMSALLGHVKNYKSEDWYERWYR